MRVSSSTDIRHSKQIWRLQAFISAKNNYKKAFLCFNLLQSNYDSFLDVNNAANIAYSQICKCLLFIRNKCTWKTVGIKLKKKMKKILRFCQCSSLIFFHMPIFNINRFRERRYGKCYLLIYCCISFSYYMIVYIVNLWLLLCSLCIYTSSWRSISFYTSNLSDVMLNADFKSIYVEVNINNLNWLIEYYKTVRTNHIYRKQQR